MKQTPELQRDLLQAVVTTSLLLLDSQNLESVADQVISQIGQALQVDRCALARCLPPDANDMHGYVCFEYEWVASGIARQTDRPELKTFGWSNYLDLMRPLIGGEPVQILTEQIARDQGRIDQELTGSISQFQYPIMVDAVLWGTLGADDCRQARIWSPSEIESLRLVATALASVVKREQLVKARIAAELQRETAILEERNRIARDIHDTLAQGFTGVAVQLQALRAALLRNDNNRAIHHADTASQLTRSSLAEARESVYMLRTEPLGSSKLIDSLEALAEQGLGSDTNVSAELSFTMLGEPHTLDTESENALLRIAQESIANMRKHAQATQCEIKLIYSADAVTLTVRDNGIGFDPSSTTAGLGLAGMRARAERLQATLLIGSARERGAEVVFTLAKRLG